MDWMSLLQTVVEVCVIPLLGVLTVYLVKFIKDKSIEIQGKVDNDTADKYIGMIADTISACVLATNQTYVEALRKEGAFTAEAQKEAFALTYDAVMSILTEEAKVYLANLYGDVTTYITAKIEAEVNKSKAV